ncbi:uncharacterized protein LOC123663938 [Melitaea cinxia]|uniref:uncharacterized protein LOC123663938 n=1 Tax=Melitaea cinxia TaxID=113334 RepID=UPI001E274C68|nr:uncharacterized protein LOC123663938 [Melitaea cinxia]
MTLLCLPIILFEMTKNEIDIIKEILRDRYLGKSDEKEELEIQNALEYINLRPLKSNKLLLSQIQKTLNYIKLRPLKYSIWRIFYMDALLPLKIVTICVTYIIVVTQFTSSV